MRVGIYLLRTFATSQISSLWLLITGPLAESWCFAYKYGQVKNVHRSS